jgi:hypothetical protein
MWLKSAPTPSDEQGNQGPLQNARAPRRSGRRVITYLKDELAPLVDVAQLIFPDMRSAGRNNEPEIL